MARLNKNWTLVAVILALALFHPTISESKALEEFRIRRIMRDITGRYHPGQHGDGAHRFGHLQSIQLESNGDSSQGGLSSVSASSSSSTGQDSEGLSHFNNIVAVNSGGVGQIVSSSSGETLALQSGYGYDFPPVVPVVPHHPHPEPCPPEHPIQPNCVCVERNRCDPSLRDYTLTSVRTIETIVCGTAFEHCCYPDPWQGLTDAFKHLAPCAAKEYCGKAYGTAATDVAYFGVIPPCPGLGTVRCMDNIAPAVSAFPYPVEEGPIHYVIPIIPNPVVPTPIVPEPVHVPESVHVPEPVHVPAVVNVPTSSYDLPVPPAPVPVVPPTVYHVPIPVPVVPPTAYHVPIPVTVEPPVVYVPPVPVPPTTYAAPIPVPPTTYAAPIPVPPTTYAAPVPVPPTTYAAPVPVPPTSYAAPAPVEYGIPGTSYGEPLSTYVANTGQFGFGGWKSLYGNRGFGGFYPGLYNSGFGFRKHIGFSKGFGFFG